MKTIEAKIYPVTNDLLASIEPYWTELFGTHDWLIGDVYKGLSLNFVNRVMFQDAAGLDAIRGKSVLYLANHQTAVESLLFIYLIGGITRTRVFAVAKEEHKSSWIGKLHRHSKRHRSGTPYDVILYFDRSKPASFLDILDGMGSLLQQRNKSILIHTEGKRALSCREATTKVSRKTLQLAMQANIPIVPVRFAGGLPVEQANSALTYPTGFGKQDIYVGSPIDPVELAKLDFSRQKEVVLSAINQLGVPVEEELPSRPNVPFKEEVRALAKRTGLSTELGPIMAALKQLPEPSRDFTELLQLLEGRGKVDEDRAANPWISEVPGLFEESGNRR
ncbi:lysophospholipid acyltransferase family protein [Cohnella soli]|uniref:Lysophospholipid acyltransferase family protein n=1 Tax=Cohnella soli TaxID=425005 RepID=A0ABW0HP68_9BACL